MKLLTTALMVSALALPVAALARDDHGRHDHEPGRGAPAHTEPGPNYRAYGGQGGGYPIYGPSGPAPGGVYGGRPSYTPPPRYGAPAPYGEARPRDPGDWNDYGSQRGAARWRRGQVFPPAYRGEALSDYYRYHLRRPPPGYYWYRNGDDFILAAVASGLIFEVVSGAGY